MGVLTKEKLCKTGEQKVYKPNVCEDKELRRDNALFGHNDGKLMHGNTSEMTGSYLYSLVLFVQIYGM